MKLMRLIDKYKENPHHESYAQFKEQQPPAPQSRNSKSRP